MSKRREWAICLTLFLIGAALAALLAPLQLDPLDDGLYMYQATSLLHGALPYRDFAMHDAPLGNLWQAFLLLLFGRDLLVLRLAMIPFKAVLLPFVYLLARPLVPRRPAILAALMVPAMDLPMNYNVPHVALNALAFTLGALLVLRMWQQQPRFAWLLLAGALIGLATGFKQNMGLYLLAGTGLWLLDTSPYVLRLAAWGGVFGAALWLVHDHLQPVVLLTLIVPIGALLVQAALSRSTTARDTSIRLPVMQLAAVGCGFLATTLPWFLWYGLQVGLGTLINGLIIGPSRLATVWFAPLSPPASQFWLFLALCLGAGVVITLLALLSRQPAPSRWTTLWLWGSLLISVVLLLSSSTSRDIVSKGIAYTVRYANIWVFWSAFLLSLRLSAGMIGRHIRLLLITAPLFALALYPQMRHIYAVWILPLFLPVAVWMLWHGAGLLAQQLPAPRQAYFYRALLVALLVIPLLGGDNILRAWLLQFVDLPQSLAQRRLVDMPLVALDLPHVHLVGTPQQRDFYWRTMATINAHSDAGAPIYSFVHQTILYTILDRSSGVKNTLPVPELTLTDGVQLRDQLIHSQVNVIVVDATAATDDGLSATDWPVWAAPIVEYLNTNFMRGAPSSYGSIWLRKPDAAQP